MIVISDCDVWRTWRQLASTVSVTIVNSRVVRSTPPRTCTVCPVLYIALPLKFVCTGRFALKCEKYGRCSTLSFGSECSTNHIHTHQTFDHFKYQSTDKRPIRNIFVALDLVGPRCPHFEVWRALAHALCHETFSPHSGLPRRSARSPLPKM